MFAINIVDGESMLSTLHDGQICLGSSIKSLNRGDIIVAKTDKLVIKRLIGLPGDTIEYINGTLYINDEPYTEDYIEKGRDNNSKTQTWKFTLEEDEYIILGDNRDGSYDSRYYGPVQGKDIIEKVYIFF